MAMHPRRKSVLMCSCTFQIDKLEELQLPLLHIPDINYTVDNCPPVPVPMIYLDGVAIILAVGCKNSIYLHTGMLLYSSVSTQEQGYHMTYTCLMPFDGQAPLCGHAC